MAILAGCAGTAQSASEPELEEATVVRVVDGDTLVADVGDQEEKIRLIGVDTPESVNLIVMYAAYLFRKRAEDNPIMPRMLRYALNQMLFAQKAGGT